MSSPATVTHYLELHRHQVADPRNVQSVDLRGAFEQPLWAYLIRVQELHPGGREYAVECAGCAFGDRERSGCGQFRGELPALSAKLSSGTRPSVTTDFPRGITAPRSRTVIPAAAVTDILGRDRRAPMLGGPGTADWARQPRADRRGKPLRERRRHPGVLTGDDHCRMVPSGVLQLDVAGQQLTAECLG